MQWKAIWIRFGKLLLLICPLHKLRESFSWNAGAATSYLLAMRMYVLNPELFRYVNWPKAKSKQNSSQPQPWNFPNIEKNTFSRQVNLITNPKLLRCTTYIGLMNYLWRITNQNWSYVPACASGVGKRAAVTQNTGCVAALHNHHHLGVDSRGISSCRKIAPLFHHRQQPCCIYNMASLSLVLFHPIPPWISPQVNTLTWLTTQVQTRHSTWSRYKRRCWSCWWPWTFSLPQRTSWFFFPFFSHFPTFSDFWKTLDKLRLFQRFSEKAFPPKKP